MACSHVQFLIVAFMILAAPTLCAEEDQQPTDGVVYPGRQHRRRKLPPPTAIDPTRITVRAENGTYKIVNYPQPPSLTQSGVPQRDSKDENPGPIVFPGQISSQKHFSPIVPESCRQTNTFCIDIPNYPESHIDGILQNTAVDVQQRIGIDELEEVSITQRIGDPDEIELCPFIERLVYPKAAQNKENKWLIIVNQPNFQQGFRVEICVPDNGPCSPEISFRIGIQAKCKQKHILRKMQALDENGNIIMDTFRLPSCCSCRLLYTTPTGKSDNN